MTHSTFPIVWLLVLPEHVVETLGNQRLPRRLSLVSDVAQEPKHGLVYDYNAKAGAPRELLKFMGSIWPDDRESAELLQEWFG